MRRYNISQAVALSAVSGPSNATYALELVTGDVPCKVFDLSIFQNGTAMPQDGTWVAFLAQITSASVGSTITPTPLDPDEGAPQTSASASPTGVTLALPLPAALLTVGGNTRVTVSWNAYGPDAAIKLDAGLTTSTGVVLGLYQETAHANLAMSTSLSFRE